MRLEGPAQTPRARTHSPALPAGEPLEKVEGAWALLLQLAMQRADAVRPGLTGVALLASLMPLVASPPG
jgi:hypothetical protein